MRTFTSLFCASALALVSTWVAAATEEGFPGRKEYPEVPVMETAELAQKIGEVVVVDSRSHYEWDTLRIKDSIVMPIADKTFDDELKKLRDKTDKPIVFYCNGRTCYKSYHAVVRGVELGLKNMYAFDAGIFEWTKAYPEKSVLLGESPADPRKLIANNSFHSKLLDPDTFADRAMSMGDGSVVLDVRDKYQRAGVGFFPGKERWASLDQTEKLQQYVDIAKRSNKTLFIYDEVGKQVQWLMYSLEKAGVKDYYFMNKGARGYYDLLVKLDNKK